MKNEYKEFIQELNQTFSVKCKRAATTIGALVNENDELKAQNAVLRAELLSVVSSEFEGCKGYDLLVADIEKKSPTVCLNQIKADAINEAVDKLRPTGIGGAIDDPSPEWVGASEMCAAFIEHAEELTK